MAGSRRPGRPTALTRQRADELVRLIDAGTTLEAAAEALGVSPRTVRSWRARAWSPRPEDGPYVALERRVVAALALAEEREKASDWRRAAAALSLELPERWPTLDEPLDGL